MAEQRYRALWSPLILETGGEIGLTQVVLRRGDLVPTDVPPKRIKHLLSMRMIEPVSAVADVA